MAHDSKCITGIVIAITILLILMLMSLISMGILLTIDKTDASDSWTVKYGWPISICALVIYGAQFVACWYFLRHTLNDKDTPLLYWNLKKED